MRHTRPPLSRRQAIGTLAALTLTHTQAMTATTTSAPPETSVVLPKSQLLGRATLRFFGLQVYEARLWTASGFDPNRYDQSPFALELAYARKLDGPAIAERSIAEMRRVGDFSEAQARTWQALMNQAFPSVVANDRLTGVHDGKGGVRFFFNGKETAAIQDKDYARLFFGIWLSPKTSAPGLRLSLLGLQD